MSEHPGPESWIDRYLNGELADDERERFEQWLLEDPAHIERLARAVLLDTQMRAAVIGRRLESGFSMLDTAEIGDDEQLQSVDQDIMNDLVAQALAERRRREIEDAANTILQAEQDKAAQASRYGRPRRRDGRDATAGRVAPNAVFWLGAAAVLGLAALLVTHFTPSSQPTPPVVHRDASPAPVLARVVRTYGAQWRGGTASWDGAHGLRQGEHRLAGGLVEIELADGARVVLEAPVSFELTGANAMTLHDGRLVVDVPSSAYGFTVDTPTARIVDYGTEFGVAADGAAQTQVHVFRGEVRAAARRGGVVVGEPVPLSTRQAGVIHADTGQVARVAFDDRAFERRVVRRLDLLDLIAGGDGTGNRRGVGIHPASGRVDPRGIVGYEQAHLASPGRYITVPANPYIDGVFVPHRGDGVQIDSAGRVVDGLAVADPRSYQLIWAGGLMPSFETEDRMREAIVQAYPGDPSAAPVLYMISNKGITFDLDAVRQAVGGAGAVRFVAEVEHVGHGEVGTLGFRSAFHCCIDGKQVGDTVVLQPLGGRHAVEADADPAERFLTLIVADGGDGLGHDWVVLHRPVLEVLVEETPGGRGN